MKNLLLGLPLLILISSLEATASYEKSEIYKVATSSMNSFKTDAEIDCFGDEFVDDWTEQYDESFMYCLNEKYRNAIKKSGFSTDIKSNSLYIENNRLAEFLKFAVLEEHGIKLKIDQYGHKMVDLDADDLTVERLRAASQYLLESLIEDN